MTISISQQAYWELIAKAQAEERNCRNLDEFECLWSYPEQLGQGYLRTIQLQAGLTLDVADYRLFDDIFTTSSGEHPLEYTFYLADEGQSQSEAERYGVFGSGMAPELEYRKPAAKRIAWISVHIEPEVFCDWLKTSADELPTPLRSLVRRSDQHYYERFGTPLASMQMVLQQMLHCPYQGLTKRLYLESKVWEMMTLVLNEVSGDAAAHPQAQSLKPEDIECIHHASQILQIRLDNPPSLLELARLARMNDHKLKLGFRQVFGTTVFGYLHEQRMERSRQLLETGKLNVTEAARAVGLVNRSYFAKAFRRKFGMNPSVYSRWQSRA